VTHKMDKHRVILPYPFFCWPRQAHAMWQFHDYGHRKKEGLFDGGGGYGAALTRTRYASLLCWPWTPASLKPSRCLPSIRASI
jgi:hypothetical protein